jgi:uncharacterized membrane protein YdfJ with MMPL/SSD domain
MRRGLIVTGGVITSAGIVLAGTFFVMAAMPMTVLTEIGFAIAIGVLFDALIVRTLLVPALGFMLGEKMWWPARFDQADVTSSNEPPQISIPAEQQAQPPVAPAGGPADSFELPLPDWTRIGGSSRYR